MEMLVLGEVILILSALVIKHLYKIYQRHKDKHKVKTVLNYLKDRTGDIKVEKLQKMLGVNDNEIKDKNK